MGLKKKFLQSNIFKKLFAKDGFYIILFLCICVVATTAVWVTKVNVDNLVTEEVEVPSLTKEKDPLDEYLNGEESRNKQPVIVVEDIEENEVINESKEEQKDEVKEASKVMNQNTKKKMKEDKSIKKENEQGKVITEEETVEEKTKEVFKESMKMPVKGKLGMGYAMDTLVYSKTLDQYTTHSGIDIMADENTPVVAALPGKVIEVKNDSKFGITIVIAHSGNVITKYANLSVDHMVKVGEQVKKGQTISGIGKTALFETLEEPHLHFEVLIDGKNVNPNTYLPVK